MTLRNARCNDKDEILLNPIYTQHRRRGRRCKQLLDTLRKRRGYWKLKEEAADRTV